MEQDPADKARLEKYIEGKLFPAEAQPAEEVAGGEPESTPKQALINIAELSIQRRS